jgi:hypothetical protein
VHVLRHLLQRAHRLLALLALPEARHAQLEQRDRREEAVEHPRAEDPARLEQREHRHQVPLDHDPAQRERAVERGAEAEQPPVLA